LLVLDELFRSLLRQDSANARAVEPRPQGQSPYFEGLEAALQSSFRQERNHFKRLPSPYPRSAAPDPAASKKGGFQQLYRSTMITVAGDAGHGGNQGTGL
jgi:N-acetylmuramoyl-L-alanine amidase